MALSEDQRALLGLLLAGDTYERVADVVGTSADEVRRRAYDAADELDAQDEPEFPTGAVTERLAALDGAPAPEAALMRLSRAIAGASASGSSPAVPRRSSSWSSWSSALEEAAVGTRTRRRPRAGRRRPCPSVSARSAALTRAAA